MRRFLYNKEQVVRIVVLSAVFCLTLSGQARGEGAPEALSVTGYFKTLNFVTESSGLKPQTAANPLDRAQRFENLYSNLERARLKFRWRLPVADPHRLTAKVDYDNQFVGGSFVGRGDYLIAKQQTENRQAVDLTDYIAEGKGGSYQQRLYRAILAYQNGDFTAEAGRQQVPWGVCHFFTPTDVFNPFSVTQIELDERDGVDALNVATRLGEALKAQFVMTPRGRSLHPQRYMGRLSRELWGFEAGALGGLVGRDWTLGYDLAGNAGDFAVRSELLFRRPEKEKNFIKFAANVDYNFPGNVYALLEYHYNGQGKSDWHDYQNDRLILGQIQQMATQYAALLVGHDFTPLLRGENSLIVNADDGSVFMRPEIRYEIQSNLVATAAAQLYMGNDGKEFGTPENLYLAELKYSF